MRRSLIVLLSLLGAGCSSSPSESEDATFETATQRATTTQCVLNTNSLNSIRTWFHFTNRDTACLATPPSGFTAGTGRDYNILNEFKRLVDQVPSGGEIRGHIFEIDIPAIAQALLNAQNRGVRVYISTSAEIPKAATQGAADSKAILDKLTNKVYCPDVVPQACLASNTSRTGTAHVKLFTFSRGTSSTQLKSPSGGLYDNAIWYGSANLSYGSGTEMFNNTVTIYGSPAMLSNMNAYLADLYAQTQYYQYFDRTSGRGLWKHASGEYYASPSPQEDFIITKLDEIVPDSSCVVRVMQNWISRTAVAQKLADMSRSGCKVMVQVGNGAATPQTVVDILQQAYNEGYRMSLRRRYSIHDKVFLTHGTSKVTGVAEYHVWTGSHNLGLTTLDNNDELLIALAAEPAGDASLRPVYNAYYNHFFESYNNATLIFERQ